MQETVKSPGFSSLSECIMGLSIFEEADTAQAMRDAGAANYLTKSGPAEELIAAIGMGALDSQKAPSAKN